MTGGGGPETPEIPDSASHAARTDSAKAINEAMPWWMVTHTYTRAKRCFLLYFDNNHIFIWNPHCSVFVFTILITMPIVTLRNTHTPMTIEIKSVYWTEFESAWCFIKEMSSCVYIETQIKYTHVVESFIKLFYGEQPRDKITIAHMWNPCFPVASWHRLWDTAGTVSSSQHSFKNQPPPWGHLHATACCKCGCKYTLLKVP